MPELRQSEEIKSGSTRAGVSVVTRGLSCAVRTKTIDPETNTYTKIILNDIDALIPRGRLVAIMGPSGSGKTTLLNAIAGRIRVPLQPAGSNLTLTSKRSKVALAGVMLFNGQHVEPVNVGAFSSYVMQSDALLPYLSVEESVNFAARLKLKGAPDGVVKKRVETVLTELGLNNCRATVVGGEMKKGISGGQKRRVSIAMELLDDPDLIFLDEPTSGLDSALAYDVVHVLQQLASSGRTVVLTIHQPRYQVFALLEELLVLAAGKVVYQGAAASAVTYFASINHPCPSTFNPADFILDLMTVRQGDVTQELKHLQSKGSRILLPGGSKCTIDVNLELERTNTTDQDLSRTRGSFNSGNDNVAGRVHISEEEFALLPTQYLDSDLRKSVLAAIDASLSETASFPISKYQSTGNSFQNWWREFFVLLHRTFINSARDPMSTVINAMSLSIFALLAGGMFWDLGYPSDPTDCTTVFNVLGVLNFSVVNLTFASMGASCRFPNDRPQINRETANGLYHSTAYSVSRIFAELPFQEIPSLLYITVIFWMTGVTRSGFDYMVALLFGMVTVFCSISFAAFIGSISKSFGIAVAIAPSVLTVVFFFGGFVVTDDALPSFIAWLRYASWMRFLFFGLVENEIGSSPATANCFYVPSSPSYWGDLGIAFLWGVFWRVCFVLGVKFCQRKIGLES